MESEKMFMLCCERRRERWFWGLRGILTFFFGFFHSV